MPQKRNADLDYARVMHTILNGTNLSGAELGGADLSDADLNYTDLSDAELSNAKNLTQAQLDRACGKDAKLPRPPSCSDLFPRRDKARYTRLDRSMLVPTNVRHPKAACRETTSPPPHGAPRVPESSDVPRPSAEMPQAPPPYGAPRVPESSDVLRPPAAMPQGPLTRLRRITPGTADSTTETADSTTAFAAQAGPVSLVRVRDRSATIPFTFLASGLAVSLGLAMIQQYCNGLPGYLAALFAVLVGSVSAGLVAMAQRPSRT
jgi:Pentapeptide repeats (8 copies)